MASDKKINDRLRPFGLTTKDLTKAELEKARKDLRGSGTGGFLSSEELISKAFKKRCCGK